MLTSFSQGNTFITASGHAEQRYSVPASDGNAMLTLDPYGFEAVLPVLRSVGLIDLCEVQSHDIVRVADMTSHWVRFFNGGHVRFAHNDRGELVELEGQRFTMRCDGDGHVLVGAHWPAYSEPDAEQR